MVLKRIGPISFAKVAGALYAVLGLVFGAIFSVISLVASTLSGEAAQGAPLLAFGVGAVVVLPVLYGAIGFVTTLIGAWLYNLAAARVGGVELDLE